MRKITIIVEDDDFVSTTTADLLCQIEDVVFDTGPCEWLPRADHNLPDMPGANDLCITVPWVENIRLDIVEK